MLRHQKDALELVMQVMQLLSHHSFCAGPTSAIPLSHPSPNFVVDLKPTSTNLRTSTLYEDGVSPGFSSAVTDSGQIPVAAIPPATMGPGP